MGEGIRWVGLDVHAVRTAVAVLDSASGELVKRTVHGRPAAVMELLESLGGPVRAVYEAGPTGYGLARRSRPGLEISVSAPGMIPTAGGGSSSRVKTDARDALKLARPPCRAADAGHGPDRRAGAGPRPGPRARGRPRRSDARPPPARQAAVAPRAVFPGPGARVDSRASRPVGIAALRRSAHRGDLRGLSARPRHAGQSSRPTRRAHRARGRLVRLRGRTRAAALP